jgi:hypothetical protein
MAPNRARKKANSTESPQSGDSAITPIKETTCKTLAGSATLTYHLGIDENGDSHLKIASNSGGGFFSTEWLAFSDIQTAFKSWPEDTPITSMALRPLFRGKSVNTPSFMLAVLTAEKLLEPMPKRKRVHRACDPTAFLATVDTLKGKAGHSMPTQKAAPRPKAKATTKATSKAKAAPNVKAKPTAKAKSPRKPAKRTSAKATRKNPKNPKTPAAPPTE